MGREKMDFLGFVGINMGYCHSRTEERSRNSYICPVAEPRERSLKKHVPSLRKSNSQHVKHCRGNTMLSVCAALGMRMG